MTGRSWPCSGRNTICWVIKRLAVAKKGIYDGLAAVEQAPNSELAKEYVAIAEMIMSGKEKREAYEHE